MTEHHHMPDMLETPPARPVKKPSKYAGVIRAAFSTSLATSGPRMRLAALGFLALYGVISAKLIYLGFKPEPATIRRAAAEAVVRLAARHSRSQRRSPRERRQGHVGLRRAAPPHRQGRGDRAPVRGAAGARRQGTSRPPRRPGKASSGSSARSRRISATRCSTLVCRASGSSPKTSASIQTGPSARMCWASPTSITRASPASRNIIDGQGLADLHNAWLRRDAGRSSADRAVARHHAPLMRCATNSPRAWSVSRPRPAPRRSWTSTRAKLSRSRRCRTTTRTIRPTRTPMRSTRFTSTA